MTARPITATDALSSRRLFGPHFQVESWNRWRAVLKATFAEPLNDNELQAFREVAERDPPSERVKVLVAAVGRGGGKDSAASFISTYTAVNFDPKTAKLRPGELVYVICLAVDRDQAGIVFRYIRAYFEEIPALRAMVKGEIGTDSIELKNRVRIEVRTNSYRSVRGRSILAAVFDEAAFWRDERSANPDTEVHGAISPGLARVKGSVLVVISSTHRRAGLLYEFWKSSFGKPDTDTLVVRGSTRQFNPLFPQGIVDRALEDDPQRYGAEYLSEWRDDLASYLNRELLEALVEPGVQVRPPLPGVAYAPFTDPSGGRSDAFTASIAHHEIHNGVERTVTDLIYSKLPPFNPSDVIEEIARLLKLYRCTTVTGDRYAAEFVVEAFRKCGITYRASKLDRSEVYLDFLPLVTAGKVLLLDHPRAIAQFASLERRTFPSGKDRIDHPLNGHDDVANSVAGAVVLASQDREQKIPIIAPVIITRSSDPTAGDTRSTTQKFYDYYNGGGPMWWGRYEMTDDDYEKMLAGPRCLTFIADPPWLAASFISWIRRQPIWARANDRLRNIAQPTDVRTTA